MKMVEVKTAELIGPALDWAAAKADGRDMRLYVPANGRVQICGVWSKGCTWSPSTDWAQGGPLIARYNIDLNHMGTKGDSIEACLNDFDLMRGWVSEGETHLVAACRAIVSAKTGDVVSVPAELVNGGGL